MQGTVRPIFQEMDDLPLGARILKSLIAPAKHSDGPTLYLICSVDNQDRCTIFEQLPDGKSMEWAEECPQGVQQAESMIYQQGNRDK